MTMHVLDTSAILNGALNDYNTSWISPLVLAELEQIKTSAHKDNNIKFQARAAIRAIINEKNINYIIAPQKKIEKIIKQYQFLSDINDHKILSEAFWMAKRTCEPVEFITSDGALYAIACQMPYLYPILYNPNVTDTTEYCGWGKYYPNDNTLTMLYEDPKVNTLKCRTNEYAQIFYEDKLKDILVWNGNEYRKLKYKDMKNPYIDEVLKPRNLEQKMAFDLLQNQDIKVKLLTSTWGGGKTLMALTYALEQVYKGRYAKLIFVRNNIIVAGTNDIGFLPGDLNAKMSIWGGPLADHLGGQEVLEQLIEDNTIEILPLSHIRGRSIRNSIVICDECENMDDKLVTLLMSRIEENSELIFCGDVAQIDSHRFEENNGIRSMVSHLSGQPLFGLVKLIKSERGPIAELCNLIRPPV